MLEPAEAACHGARPVPHRILGLGMRAPGPGRNDGLEAPTRELGAEGVAVIGLIRDQAGWGRAGLGFHQGAGLGAIVAQTARHAQAQRAALSIR